MPTLLQQIHDERAERQRADFVSIRRQLAEALHQLVPGRQVIVFGSLARSEDFSRSSDIDIAIESLPDGMSLYTLTALLEEAVRRPVDVVLLSESRLREKIIATGETWTA